MYKINYRWVYDYKKTVVKNIKSKKMPVISRKSAGTGKLSVVCGYKLIFSSSDNHYIKFSLRFCRRSMQSLK